MPSGALGMISKISSKFFHEVMPVALASVIGTMLVNHYSRQPISPPVVVQATPPASAEAMFQTLRDEQVLIADYLRRDADAKRDADAARDASIVRCARGRRPAEQGPPGFGREGRAASACEAAVRKNDRGPRSCAP